MTQTVYPAEAMTTQMATHPAVEQEPTRRRGARRVLLESGYAISAFPIALAAFVVVLVDLALGVSLVIFIGGVLLISVGVMVARGFARFERLRLRLMLGRRAATPSYV